MQWRTKRKLTYTLIIVLPLAAIAFGIYWATFFPDPTCFDGEQNGTEMGIDCGGECAAVCQAQTPAVDAVWSRAFSVSGDVYNLATYIENPNTDLVAHDVPYVFRVYDKDNILITERRGSTTLLPQPVNAVFVGGVETNGRVPARTTFSFRESPFWEAARVSNVRFQISNERLQNTESRPRLELSATNQNQTPYQNLRLVPVIFDSTNQAVHVSRTVIPEMPIGEEKQAVFTWREAFSATGTSSYRIEVIPTYYEPLP